MDFVRSYLSSQKGFYIFLPNFQDHFFAFKEVFSENSVLMYGLYSRAAYDGARTVLKIIHFHKPCELEYFRHNPLM